MSSAHAGSVSRREGWGCGRGEAATDERGPDGHSVSSTGRCQCLHLVSSKMDVGRTLASQAHSSPEPTVDLAHPPVNTWRVRCGHHHRGGGLPLMLHGVSRYGAEAVLLLTVH